MILVLRIVRVAQTAALTIVMVSNAVLIVDLIVEKTALDAVTIILLAVINAEMTAGVVSLSVAMISLRISTEYGPVPEPVPLWQEARRQTAPSRNALITLDADVARVFATSEAVNAALRHLIALAGIMGEDAIKQATREIENTQAEEVTQSPEEPAAVQAQPVAEFQTTDEDEEWFDLPVEGEKAE